MNQPTYTYSDPKVQRYQQLMEMLFACIDAEAGTQECEYCKRTDDAIDEISIVFCQILGLPEDFHL